MTPEAHLKLSLTCRCFLANSVYSLQEENCRDRVVCHLHRAGNRLLNSGRDQKSKIPGRILSGEERCDVGKCSPILSSCLELRKKKEEHDLKFTIAAFLSLVATTDSFMSSILPSPLGYQLFVFPVLLNLKGKSIAWTRNSWHWWQQIVTIFKATVQNATQMICLTLDSGQQWKKHSWMSVTDTLL